MDKKLGRETQSGFARYFPDPGKGNEFGQHVVVREMMPFALEETLCLPMLGFILRVITQEAGRIEED